MEQGGTCNRSFGYFFAAGLLLASALPLLCAPRPPLPPWPEPNPLSVLAFDAALSPARDDSTCALGTEFASLVDGWSGYALEREGLMVSPLVLCGTSTPVNVVTHVGEPQLPFVNDSKLDFECWANTKSFGVFEDY